MGRSVLNQHQPSLTEWLSSIGEIDQSNAFRQEDNTKADRLETLYQTIGLLYERPEKLSATDLSQLKPVFKKILDERGDELCAIRLVPTKKDLPKLRNRGQSIKECYKSWFLKQDINPKDYIAYICPHSDELLWSAILVINKDMIFGEIVRGLHSQLTQGANETPVLTFHYDFKNWTWSHSDEEAQVTIKKAIKNIKVTDQNKQNKLKELLDAEFSHNYLHGYFEMTVWPDNTIYFIDYNRILPALITTPKQKRTAIQDAILKGITAYPGKVKGKVVKVNNENISEINFTQGSVLVCDYTDVRFLPFMKKAAAVVTNRGGLLSHASIIARELKTPCLIGTKDATALLRTGDVIEVNADTGTVTRL